MCPNWVCVCVCELVCGIYWHQGYHTAWQDIIHTTPGHAFTIIHYADSEVRSGNGDDVRTRYTHSLGQETETE